MLVADPALRARRRRPVRAGAAPARRAAGGQLAGRLARHPRVPSAGGRRAGSGGGQGRRPTRADQPAHPGRVQPLLRRPRRGGARHHLGRRVAGRERAAAAPVGGRGEHVRRRRPPALTARTPAGGIHKRGVQPAEASWRARAACTSSMCVSAQALIARCTGRQALAQRGELVVDPGRHADGHRSADQAVALELAQCLGEHLLARARPPSGPVRCAVAARRPMRSRPASATCRSASPAPRDPGTRPETRCRSDGPARGARWRSWWPLRPPGCPGHPKVPPSRRMLTLLASMA